MKKYHGEPRPELDKAWADLLEHNNIRLTEDELKRLNRTALKLSDGSGYFGQLGAYHHLHCLVRDALDPFVNSTPAPKLMIESRNTFVRSCTLTTMILTRPIEMSMLVSNYTKFLPCPVKRNILLTTCNYDRY